MGAPSRLDSNHPGMVALFHQRGVHEAHQRGSADHAGQPAIRGLARFPSCSAPTRAEPSSTRPWRRPTRSSSSRAGGCASSCPRTSRSSPWPSWNGATSIPPTPGPTWPPWMTAPCGPWTPAISTPPCPSTRVWPGSMINVLGGLLKNSMSIISGLVFNDVTRRLVQYLLAEARGSRERDARGVLVRLDLTTEQMAQIVGSTRQNRVHAHQRYGARRRSAEGSSAACSACPTCPAWKPIWTSPRGPMARYYGFIFRVTRPRAPSPLAAYRPGAVPPLQYILSMPFCQPADIRDALGVLWHCHE